MNNRRKWVTKYGLPLVIADRIYAGVGVLMSYGPLLADLYQPTTAYVDKLFKDAKPADLPVEQLTKFELIINRKAAKALDLTISRSLVLSDGKVIE